MQNICTAAKGNSAFILYYCLPPKCHYNEIINCSNKGRGKGTKVNSVNNKLKSLRIRRWLKGIRMKNELRRGDLKKP